MIGSGVPPEDAFLQASKNAYDRIAPNTIGSFVKILDTATFDAYLRLSDKTILLASRGTDILSWQDIKADAYLMSNQLKNTKRYKQDARILTGLIKSYPPSEYEYYIAGHSLSVAIATQLMRDFPFIKKAVGYNGAFQMADLRNQNTDIKRLYTDKDFLYNLGGRFFSGVQLVPMKETTAQSFFDRIRKTITPASIEGHSLKNFDTLYEGSGMIDRLSIIRRIRDGRTSGGALAGGALAGGGIVDDITETLGSAIADIITFFSPKSAVGKLNRRGKIRRREIEEIKEIDPKNWQQINRIRKRYGQEIKDLEAVGYGMNYRTGSGIKENLDILGRELDKAVDKRRQLMEEAPTEDRQTEIRRLSFYILGLGDKILPLLHSETKKTTSK